MEDGSTGLYVVTNVITARASSSLCVAWRVTLPRAAVVDETTGRLLVTKFTADRAAVLSTSGLPIGIVRPPRQTVNRIDALTLVLHGTGIEWLKNPARLENRKRFGDHPMIAATVRPLSVGGCLLRCEEHPNHIGRAFQIPLTDSPHAIDSLSDCGPFNGDDGVRVVCLIPTHSTTTSSTISTPKNSSSCV